MFGTTGEILTGSASSDEEVVDFLVNGCGCTKCFNGPCSGGLNVDIVTDYHLAITELDSSELNVAIVAQLHAEMNNGELLINTRGSARPGIRQRITFQYSRECLFARKCSFSFTG